MDRKKTNILSQHVYKFIKDHFEKLPGNFFEIGIFNGVGTAYIAATFPNRKIFAVDPFIEDGHTTGASGTRRGRSMPNQREASINNLSPHNNVLLIESRSSEVALYLTAQDIINYNVTWVVIDGSHHYKDVVIDAELARCLIDDKRGIIVFDDLQHNGVMQAYNEFKEKYSFRIVNEQKIGFHESCGILEFSGIVRNSAILEFIGKE